MTLENPIHEPQIIGKTSAPSNHLVDAAAYSANPVIRPTEPEKPRSGFRIVADVARDLATDTPTLFSVGDLVMAFNKGERIGIATNVAVASATIGSRIYQSVTGKGEGLGYVWVTLNQAITGASILTEGTERLGVHGMLGGTPEANKILETAFIFGMSVPALALEWWQKSHHTKPEGGLLKKTLQSSTTYLGIGSIFGTMGGRVPAAPLLFAAGLTRQIASHFTNAASLANTKVGRFIQSETSTKNLYRSGYVVAGLLAFHDPLYASAFLLWGAGYQFIDKGKADAQQAELDIVQAQNEADISVTARQTEFSDIGKFYEPDRILGAEPSMPAHDMSLKI